MEEATMKVTISAIKADVGSIGGHTKPSAQMLVSVRQEVSPAIASGLLIDGFVSHTGDDIAILMSHTRGESAAEVHQFAWESFFKATKVHRNMVSTAPARTCWWTHRPAICVVPARVWLKSSSITP